MVEIPLSWTRHRVRWATVLLGMVLLTGGCGDGNKISGSIDEAFPMEFDRVVIRVQGLTLRIDYINDLADSGAGDTGRTTTVLGIIIKDVPAAGIGVDVKLEKDDFLKHVSLVRVVPSSRELPQVKAGTLVLRKFDFRPRGRVKGLLDVVFANGRSLGADFDGRIEE